MILHVNFFNCTLSSFLGKCPPFFTILSSKCILASGHPVQDTTFIHVSNSSGTSVESSSRQEKRRPRIGSFVFGNKLKSGELMSGL